MIFLLNCQKNPALFMQKTELIYPKNCQIHSGLLLKLFKAADFLKKS